MTLTITTVLLPLLLLPVTVVWSSLDDRYYLESLSGPSFTKDPLAYVPKITFTTAGFGVDPVPKFDYISNKTRKTWVEFERTEDFPAYFEVRVSGTDILGRDPETRRCLEDSLRFYEGNSTDDPLLAEVCGTETPTFDTTGLKVLVVYKTNETHQAPYAGGAFVEFRAVYGQIPLLVATRYKLERIVFPHFGYPTQENSTSPPPPPPIRRTITMITQEQQDETDIVAVHVTDTDMSGYDSAGNCSRDKVIFYDGSNTSAPVLATVCGSDTPTIRSTGRYMTVHFEGTSMPEGVKRGMSFFYKAESTGNGGDGGNRAGIVNVFVVAVALITASIVY